jgi:hypothetical protein
MYITSSKMQPCSVVDRCQCFRGNCHLCLQGKGHILSTEVYSAFYVSVKEQAT